MHTSIEKHDRVKPGRDLAKAVDLFYQISSCVLLTQDFKKLNGNLYKLFRELLPCDRVCVFPLNENGSKLDRVFFVNGRERHGSALEYLSAEMAGKVMRTRDVVIHNSYPPSDAARHQQKMVRSAIVAPVIFCGEVVGIISAQSCRPKRFTSNDAKLLQIICSQLGGVLNRGVSAPDNNKTNQQHGLEKLSMIMDLAKNISHEMNQPLTGISGFCALIKEQINADHSIYHDLTQIENQARRLEELIYNFQNIVRLNLPKEVQNHQSPQSAEFHSACSGIGK